LLADSVLSQKSREQARTEIAIARNRSLRSVRIVGGNVAGYVKMARLGDLEQFSGWSSGHCGTGFQPAPQCHINLRTAPKRLLQ
jgi:hypothetical protein